MEHTELNEQHRRIAEEARERIRRLISGEALRGLVERVDTKLANAINGPDDE